MLDLSHIQRLNDIGMAACHYGRVASAKSIFEGVLAQKPDFAPALIGKALSHIVVNEFEEAIALLKEKVLDANPEDAEAEAVLGLAYFLDKNPAEARPRLESAARSGGPSAGLAATLLAELE